jgi:peptidoglycan/LPS O-acetylase OafA/YrhL
MKSNTAEYVYFPHIDGLRALAVIAVIMYHLNPRWLISGYVGVDVFFVISGFVVSMSVHKLDAANRVQFLLAFYSRRILRIVPALIFCLLITNIAAALFIPNAWLSSKSQASGIAAYFGLSNFVLAMTGNDYFSPAADFNPYTHTWSLGVEEQFYFIFPLLFFSWLVKDTNGKKRSLTVFAVGALLSFIVSTWLKNSYASLSFYMIVSRFWELAAGVILFQAIALYTPPASPASQSLLKRIGALVSIGLLVIAATVAEQASFPGPVSVLAVIGTLGVLYCLHGNNDGLASRVLTNGLVRHIGNISYSLYLWHWPVFVMFRWTVGIESTQARILALVATLVLALASFRFIEKPIRNASLFKAAPRFKVAGLGFASMATASVISLALVVWQSSFSLSTVARNDKDWYAHKMPLQTSSAPCDVEQTKQSMGGDEIYVLYSPKCADLSANNHRIFVIGDSHATHYIGMLKQFIVNTGTTVYLYHNAGCGFLTLRAPDKPESRCGRLNDATFTHLLLKLRQNDVVFLSSLRLARLSDQWVQFDQSRANAAMLSKQAMAERKEAEAQALPKLKQLASKGAKIVFAAPTPIFKSPPFRCADWFNKFNPICHGGGEISRSEIETYRMPVMTSFDVLAKAVPQVTIWDPFLIICPNKQCSSTMDGHPLFFDGDHLSGYSNALLFRNFESMMDQLLSSTTLGD